MGTTKRRELAGVELRAGRWTVLVALVSVPRAGVAGRSHAAPR